MNCGNDQFSPSEDCQEGPLWFLQRHGEVVELLLHQETSRLLRKIHSHHGAGREEEKEQRKEEQRKRMKENVVKNQQTFLMYHHVSSIHLHCIQTAGSPVGSVSRAKGIVDVNVSEFGQRSPEGVDLLLGGLSLRDRKTQETV